jgi:hypothetical protein
VTLARLTGLVGLACFACIAIGALVAPPLWSAPDTAASAQTIFAYAEEHRDRILASLFAYSLAMGLFLCFAAGLTIWLLRLRSAVSGALSIAFALAAVALVTLILAGFVPGGVSAYRPQSPALARAFLDLTFALLAFSGIPTAICLGAYVALVLPTKALPAWTGWLACLGAVAHLLIATTLLFPSGFLSLEGDVIVWVPATFFAWILLTSVALLRDGGGAPP